MSRKAPQQTPMSVTELQEEIRSFGGLPLSHDKLFDAMFHIAELAIAFLRAVLPSMMLEKLDLEKLTIERKDFIGPTFRETRADMIYRLPIRGSDQSICVYAVLEHKSVDDFFTIFQAFYYAIQINLREMQLAKEKGCFDKTFRFSPVLIIIFHHGEGRFTGPTDLKGVYNDGNGIFAECVPNCQAILFDLSTLPESKIPNDPDVPELNAVLQIMRKITNIDIGTKIKEVLEQLKPYSNSPKYRRIIRYLWYYVVSNAKAHSNLNLAEINEIIAKSGERDMSTFLEQYLAKGEARGRAEGEAQGRAEGEARGKAEKTVEMLLKILSRLDAVPEALAEKIHAISDIEELDRLADIALDCRSLDEFTKHLS